MFGRKPFDWLAGLETGAPDLMDEFTALMDAEFTRTVIHFGEGRLNPSTIACILAEIERTLATRHGVTLPDSPAARARRSLTGFRLDTT